MEFDVSQKRRLTAYLLGELADADKALLEDEFMRSEELFEALTTLEQELCKDYAAGRLPEDISAKFERQMQADQILRSKVHEEELWRVLAAREHVSQAEPSWFRRLWTMPGWTRRRLLAATSFAAVAGIGVWLAERGLPDANASLTPGTVQGNSNQQFVEVHWGARRVTLALHTQRLPMPLDSPAVLRDVDQRLVWEGTASSANNTLHATIPSDKLPAGHYTLTVTMAPDNVETYSFAVRR